MNLLTIVIVNWNAGPKLADCIVSIALYHSGLVSSVVIIDNASSDDSLAQVGGFKRLPFQLHIVRNNDNHGFGAACNQGAALGTSEYLLFLNPDAMVFSGSVDKVLAFMQDPANEKVGICGVQLVGEDGEIARSCARFLSVIGFLSHAIGLDRVLPRLGHCMAEWSHDVTREVDHVIGAFFLVRRTLFETLGGFDERFFVYYEDVDFSYRARCAGWRSVYLADVQAYHAGGGTSHQVKAKRLFYSLRSRLLYVFKHFKKIDACAVLLVTLFVEPLSRLVLAVMRLSWCSFKETCQGYWLLFRWLPEWIIEGYTR